MSDNAGLLAKPLLAALVGVLGARAWPKQKRESSRALAQKTF